MKVLRFVSLMVLGYLFVLAGLAEGAPNEWELPEGAGIDPPSLLVSSDCNYVLFLEPGVSARHTPQSIRKLFPAAYWLLNTRTGKFSNIMEILPVPEGKGKLLIKPCGISGNGRYALVLATRIVPSSVAGKKQRGYAAFLLTLASGSVEKIGEEVVHATWVGDRIALNYLWRRDKEAEMEEEFSSDTEAESDTEDDGNKSKKRKVNPAALGKHRRTQRMMLYDPRTKSTTRLESRGIIIAGHRDGILLVFGYRVKDPTKAITLGVLVDSKMTVVNLEGDSLRQLDFKPLGVRKGSRPIISANGKYFAFRQGRIVRGRKPRKVIIRVLTTTGDEEWTIEQIGTPIGMADDGRVITIGNVYEPDGAAVQIWDRDLSSHTVMAHVAAATVVGNQLFYLTTGEKPVFRAINLGL